MNDRALALMAMDAYAIGCVYNEGGTVYVFASVQPVDIGELVLVPTKDGFYRTVRVVDNDEEFDISSKYDYTFIVGEVITKQHDECKKRLKDAVKQIRKQRRKNIRQSALQEIEGHKIAKITKGT